MTTAETNDVILVTGATGGVGGQVVEQLLAEGGSHPVRGLTRNAATAHLPEGAEVVQGDLADATSLDQALEGVTKIFLVWPTMFVEEAPGEVIDKLARQASRIVYLSERRALEAAADGSFAPAFHPFPLSEVAAAHRDLEDRRTTGKVILVP